MSKLDKKKKDRKEKPPTFLDKVKALLIITFTRLIQIFIFLFLGILAVTTARLSQTKLMPDCLTAEPYTPTKLTPEQIHLDFLTNKDKSGEYRSIKATYPLNYNKNIIEHSFIFKVIKTLTRGPDSSVAGNYVGVTLGGMAQGYISLYESLLSLFNSILPEFVFMLIGIFLILIIHIIAILVTTCKGIIAFFSNMHLFFYEKELVEVDGAQETKWKEGKCGPWDGDNWKMSILIYMSLFLGLIFIIPTCSLFSIMMLFTLFFIPFFLLRIYSSTKDINGALKKKAKEMTMGGNGDIMAGGGDDSGDTEDNDKEDSDDSDDNDSENESDDEGDTINGEPHPGLPKRFKILSHYKKFIKLYRNYLMILFSLYLIKDTLGIFGPIMMVVVICAIILVWYGGSTLYKAYKIKSNDKFTSFLMGTNLAKKVCKVPLLKPKDEEETNDKKWYFLWLM